MSASNVVEKNSKPNVKILFESLCEISSILGNTEQKLEDLVNGPSPKQEAKDATAPNQIVTLDMLENIIHTIGRRTNIISKYTNTIVGN